MFKIKLFGFKSPVSCYEQVKQEFICLGHEIIENGECNFCLHLNGFFREMLDWKVINAPNSISIGILLDAAPESVLWPAEMARQELLELDVACTISQTSNDQIVNRTGVSCNVVYYPIKNVKFKNYARTVDFCTIGRVSGNKRLNLMGETIEKLGLNRNMLIVAGPEKPPFGVYTTLLPLEELEDLYNGAKYVFNFCSADGLGLNSIESIVCRAAPVLCNDNKVVEELGLEEFAADPNPTSLAAKILTIQQNRDYFNNLIEEKAVVFEKQFSVEAFCQRILSLYHQKKSLA